MAESFGEKLDTKIADKYMNSTGFLKDTEFKKYEGLNSKGKLKKINYKKNIDKEEYGFKIKGPEPNS